MKQEFQADYRYSIRLVYLTGATLFLAVLLTRVVAIVLDLINSQEQLNQLKTNVSCVLSAACSTESSQCRNGG
jgi:hypothetical protein